jgi:hypothetical protein
VREREKEKKVDQSYRGMMRLVGEKYKREKDQEKKKRHTTSG